MFGKRLKRKQQFYVSLLSTYFIPPYFVRLLMILDRTTQASPNIAFRVGGGGTGGKVKHKKTKVEVRAKNRGGIFQNKMLT